MWKLTRKDAQLLHMNTRTEKAGDEGRLACDLRIGCTVPNTFLDDVCVGLRSALYERPAEKDLLDDDGYLPIISFPGLAPIEWDREWTNCRVTLHYGIRDDGDVVLDGVVINKLVLTLRDGGSVDARFRVQWHPDVEGHPEYMGKLAMMLEGKAISITVEQIEQEPEGAGDAGGVIDGTTGPKTASNPALDEPAAQAGDASIGDGGKRSRRRERETMDVE